MLKDWSRLSRRPRFSFCMSNTSSNICCSKIYFQDSISWIPNCPRTAFKRASHQH
jgi:hypothetical protein